mmetsp:Transcript_59422/g.173884  ORF Transcript_59422/g.173884 Transcript_59422/m.173884 type:complete len:259 (-) Transcript_59422:735-1511(-)
MRLATASSKASCANLSLTASRAAAAMRSRSSELMAKTCRSAAAYDASSEARKPVGCPPSGTTMSISGPPDWCARAMAPAAMNSTTLMPKCSSRMVCRPTAAWDRSACTSSREMFVRKRTSQSAAPPPPSRSRRPSSDARARSASTRSRSPASRQPPARIRRTRFSPGARREGSSRRKRSKARSWSAWFFSGRNCASETTTCPPPSASPRRSGSAARAAVSHGGNTVAVRCGTCQRKSTCPRVQEELTITTSAKRPTKP